MPRITVDGKSIECKDRQMILQACLDAGYELPHYCYHAGLSIPASCRICLVEVEGVPKLVPSCNTTIRDGMVVHSRSPKAIANQKQVMEYLLISHPLDCPVCDQAGECFLQDYSYEYGRSQSRFEEDKYKRPKKDVGLNVLLYNDRCIMCSRCVRFTREVSGESELFVEGRGFKEEISIFPGKPLDNKLSLNVVDLCPVGALLEKEFLFKQRVWLLKETPSISPADSGGENIWIHHNEGIIYRIKPRYNAEINAWWCSDDTRYTYKPVHDKRRLQSPRHTEHGVQVDTSFAKAIEAADEGLKKVVKENGPGSLYAMLSPMMACEEAYLLGKYIRSIDPQAVLVLGPVPTTGKNEEFKHYMTGKTTFVIQGEKVPNRAGIRRVMELLGEPHSDFSALTNAVLPASAGSEIQKLKGGWIVGGYLSSWIPIDHQPAIFTSGFRVVQDLLPSSLSEKADILLPAAAWAEKDGCWENYAGKIQPFIAAVPPPEGARREGDVYYKLLGWPGSYNAEDVRHEMGEPFTSIRLPDVHEPAPSPEFVEL